MNFAVKMWGWTRIGARVVITPGELTPESFSHPLLATQKTPPAVASLEPPRSVEVAVTTKSDRAAAVNPALPPTFSEASLELKSTVGHDLTKPVPGTHTADASSALSRPRSPVTIIDAPVASSLAMKVGDDAGGPSDKAGDARVKTESVAEETATHDTPASEPVKAESVVPEAVKAQTAEVADMKAGAPTTAATDGSKAVNKIEEAVKATADADAASPDVKKDQARPSDPEKAVPKPDALVAAGPKRSGRIAVFVSKKDGKLYVRQNFAPLFDVPVTIARSDRPLGTHVFTAQTDKDDANLLHWSVVSMPVVARNAARQDDDERVSRRRKTTGAIEVKPAPLPDSATEALDRLTIPADTMARINEALSTGGSIIVSDQGINGGETGEGTDFIIPLR
jgi:hypothetical protein